MAHFIQQGTGLFYIQQTERHAYVTIGHVAPVSTGGGGGAGRYRGGARRARRRGEKVIWHDDWVRAQEELTRVKAKPEELQAAVVEAVEALEEAAPELGVVAEAQEIIAEAGRELDGIAERLASLESLDAILLAYFALQMDRQRDFRREQDIAAMLVLGIL